MRAMCRCGRNPPSSNTFTTHASDNACIFMLCVLLVIMKINILLSPKREFQCAHSCMCVSYCLSEVLIYEIGFLTITITFWSVKLQCPFSLWFGRCISSYPHDPCTLLVSQKSQFVSLCETHRLWCNWPWAWRWGPSIQSTDLDWLAIRGFVIAGC